jgi:aminomethyltransferase
MLYCNSIILKHEHTAVKRMKRLLLEEVHEDAGAQFIEFAGWRMPLQYTSIVSEHMAVRERAGLFDVSHMGEFLITGPGALEFLQRVTSNDVSKLAEGGAQYSTVLNEHGGVKDDVVIYRLAKARFLLVCNAVNIEKLERWFDEQKDPKTEVANISDNTVLLALQGPLAQQILQPLTPVDLRTIQRFHGQWVELAGIRCWVGRTGYTGEDGFEIFLMDLKEKDPAVKIWRSLVDAGRSYGLALCGLGARDTTRLEAGLCLYGNELNEDITPLEARISFVVKFEKPEFIGKDALLELKQSGLKRVRVGLRMLESGVPRKGMKVLREGEVIGEITSGTFSPVLKRGIAMGYVPPSLEFGQHVEVEVHGRAKRAELVKWPFYDQTRYGWSRE